MTNQAILEKAVNKAIKNGWSPGFQSLGDFLEWGGSYRQLIYNHDFAKVLWGEELWFTAVPGKFGKKRIEHEIPAWQMHLQQMVISEDPIKYLGENV